MFFGRAEQSVKRLIPLGCLLVLAISFAGCRRSAESVAENSSQERRVGECRREALNELHLPTLEIGTLQSVQTLCFVRVGNEDELSEASIRRNAYTTQQAET